MAYLIFIVLIEAAFIIHVLKTGRNTLWIWVLVIVPLAGMVAYVAIEILPELMGTRAARRVVAGAKRTIDPTRDLRAAQQQLRGNESIDARRRVAEELMQHGEYAQAAEHYRLTLTGLYEHDPHLLLGLARAQFAMGEAAQARQTLDRLIQQNPGFKSAEGHLLYARALVGEGNYSKAGEEFAELVKYYPGAEAKYRYAALLGETGRSAEARALLERLLEEAELATRHYRKTQADWLNLARRELEKH
jgi:hypothetical protein